MIGVSARGFSWTHMGRSKPALHTIDLDIAPGEKVLLCGNSGSGKSTLAAAIAGVLGGDEEGTQQGELLLRSADSESSYPAAAGEIPVGLVLQDPDSQVIAARVGDDVAFGCENVAVPRDEIWQRVEQALELVGLEIPISHPTSQLSGGQKQRLALAGVIAMGAGLLILDEPTANLDPAGAAEVVAAVATIAAQQSLTVIVVEHNYKVWEGFLDRAIELDHGEVTADGSFADVTARRVITGLPSAQPVTATAGPALWSRELQTRFGPPRTLAIPAGASTVITGRNGSGKSTWLLTMAGLLEYTAGEIGMSQEVAQGLVPPPHRWKSAQLAQRIGFVFQNPEHQFVSRTVREELALGPKVMGVGHERIDGLVERLRLGHLLDANPFTLSGGEKRRLSVATALVSAPQAVLFDEPTFGQDPHTFAELVVLLRELVDSGVTIASITHDPYFMQSLGDAHIDFDRLNGSVAGGQR